MNALNIAPFVEAKSDRIVADDLIAGPQTYKVAGVKGVVDEKKEKRLVMTLEGAQKPYIPCKGMVRLLGNLWGPDAGKWIGRTLTIYRDPEVRFGADQPGGIRICAVSDIDRPQLVSVRTSQKTVKGYQVKPLANDPTDDPAAKWAAAYISKVTAAPDRVSLEQYHASKEDRLPALAEARPDLHRDCVAALEAKRAEFAPEGKPDEAHGDQFDGTGED